MTQRLAFGAVVLVVALAHSAAAETRSWTAIKGKLPADAMLVVGFDVNQARAASSFGKLVEAVTSESHDLGDGLALVKTTCGIDPVTAVTDVTIVMRKDEKGIVVVGMTGVDEAKLLVCANKLQAKDNPKKTITGKKVGAVTEYSVTDEKDKLYVAWLAKDVVAFSFDPDKRVVLDAAIGGKGATGDLARSLAKTSPSAFVFGAASIGKEGIAGGFGSITLAKGVLTGSMKMTAQSGELGTTLLAEITKELARDIERSTKKAPTLATVLKGIKVSGKGAEITIDAAVNEADLPGLIPALDKIF